MQIVRDELANIMQVPDSDIGYIELSFEMMRRYRVAYGYKVPQVQGNPLAPSVNGPYPSILDDHVLDAGTLRIGFTQEQVDAWCDEYYAGHKKI